MCSIVQRENGLWYILCMTGRACNHWYLEYLGNLCLKDLKTLVYLSSLVRKMLERIWLRKKLFHPSVVFPQSFLCVTVDGLMNGNTFQNVLYSFGLNCLWRLHLQFIEDIRVYYISYISLFHLSQYSFHWQPVFQTGGLPGDIRNWTWDFLHAKPYTNGELWSISLL